MLRGCSDDTLGATLSYVLEVPNSYKVVSPLSTLRACIVEASRDTNVSDYVLCQLVLDHSDSNASLDCLNNKANRFVYTESLVFHFRAFSWRWALAEFDVHSYMSLGMAWVPEQELLLVSSYVRGCILSMSFELERPGVARQRCLAAAP